MARGHEPRTTGNHHRWLTVGLAGVVCILAALLRLLASRGDFWLDEIWVLSFMPHLRSGWDVLTRIHHENNHHLNTWIMLQLGPVADWRIYRLPAVLAGVATVLALGLSTRHRGPLHLLTALVLTGSSYLMVHYSSEARGYSYALLFSALSFGFMRRALALPLSTNTDTSCQHPGRASSEISFALCALGGFLSHPTFIYCYVSLVMWWVAHWSGRAIRRDLLLASAVRCHALPTAFLLWLYTTDLRHAVNGGGPIIPLTTVLVETLSLTAGGPADGIWAVLVAFVGAAACIFGVLLLRRRQDDSWIFFSLVTLVTPVSLILILKRPEVYPRYFLIAALFQLLLLSEVLSHCFRQGLRGRIAYGALVLALLIGNGVHIERLIQVGRGNYLEALRYVEAHTPGREMSIGSDHDFRNSMVIDFYRPYLHSGKTLRYYTQSEWPPEGPDWVLLHSQEASWTPPRHISDVRQHRYTLYGVYPFAGLSGWHWAVYGRGEAPAHEAAPRQRPANSSSRTRLETSWRGTVQVRLSAFRASPIHGLP